MANDVPATVVALLAEAQGRCKTKRALAAAIGTTEQNLQAIFRGDRHLTAAQCIALASLIGRPAPEVLAIDAVDRAKEPQERERLREGFFRRGIAGGLAALLLAAGASPEASALDLSRLTVYTLCAVLALMAWRLGTGPPYSHR